MYVWVKTFYSCPQHSLLEKERSLQEQMDELRTNLASLNQARSIKEKMTADDRKKISEIGRELAAIGSGGAALDSAEQELHSAVSECLVHIFLPVAWGVGSLFHL